MLKALELAGFKSFADKTRFEFPDGITVIVGPNGSGKSNIVDAIKWVLGEQRVKSLRGKEMSDIIFKGSGSGKRKPGNSAEATIIFDNADSRLEIDAPEVHVTRRLYRSGEGEYLINGQACRLRDVKDLFRGTGVGADAYSLIEQGKVDTLLQASPKDRRAMFEEAAGISRFKVKKIEAQRRLERVEQNLLRLSDIVDEVDHRLRRLKSQAGKARRYKEYSGRLQELRTHVARVDWQTLSDELVAVTTQLERQEEQLQQRQTQLTEAERCFQELESQLSAAEDLLRRKEAEVSKTRERLAADQSTIRHEHGLLKQLDDESVRLSRQLLVLCSRAGGLQSSLEDAAELANTTGSELTACVEQRDHQQKAYDDVQSQMEQLRTTHDQRREKFLAHVRQLSELESNHEARRTLLTSHCETLERLDGKLDELIADVASAEAVHQQAVERLRSTQEEAEKTNHQIRTARKRAKEGAKTLDSTDALLATKRQRTAAATERAALLTEIETQLEGVGSGVKEALQRARDEPDGPYGGIRGMVADLLAARDPTMAEMLDAALGEKTQLLVFAGQQLVEHLQVEPCDLPGRVGLIRLESSPPGHAGSGTDLTDQSGVIGLATQFVETAPEYEHLATWLLGDTWFVESLVDAVEFSRSLRAPLRFVTRAGEVLERDGRLLIGHGEASLGLLSRRAELKSLQVEIDQLHEDVAALQQTREECLASAGRIQDQLEQLEATVTEENKRVSNATVELESAKRRKVQLDERQAELLGERGTVETAMGELSAYLESNDQALEQLAAQVSEGEAAIESFKRELEECEAEQQRMLRRLTAAQVEVAKREQKHEAQCTRLDQLRRDQSERHQAVVEARQQWLHCQRRQREANLRILTASSYVNELSIGMELKSVGVKEFADNLQESKRQRTSIQAVVVQHRKVLTELQHQLQRGEMAVARIELERTTLSRRIKDDYGVDVADLVAGCAADSAAELASQREAVDHKNQVASDDIEESIPDDLDRRDPVADGEKPGEEYPGDQERDEAYAAGEVVVDEKAGDNADDAEDDPGGRDDDDNAASSVQPPRSQIESEISHLREKLSNLGSVNMDAVDELEDLENRFSTLSGQYEDLVESKEALQRIIHKINADSRRLFVETLEAIRTNFRKMFRKVFGGGHADIVMDPDVDILESGVDVIATPPGKQSLGLSLLSGGERALTAVTLLLAIFEYRPSPFCVLDEVDGPLDEANIGRFVDVLDDFLSWTKFVVVTHSKKTMTAAHTLYGVTMEESGVSKKVSVRFDDVGAAGEISRSALERHAGGSDRGVA